MVVGSIGLEGQRLAIAGGGRAVVCKRLLSLGQHDMVRRLRRIRLDRGGQELSGLAGPSRLQRQVTQQVQRGGLSRLLVEHAAVNRLGLGELPLLVQLPAELELFVERGHLFTRPEPAS
jgi:hypothetical protein